MFSGIKVTFANIIKNINFDKKSTTLIRSYRYGEELINTLKCKNFDKYVACFKL